MSYYDTKTYTNPMGRLKHLRKIERCFKGMNLNTEGLSHPSNLIMGGLRDELDRVRLEIKTIQERMKGNGLPLVTPMSEGE